MDIYDQETNSEAHRNSIWTNGRPKGKIDSNILIFKMEMRLQVERLEKELEFYRTVQEKSVEYTNELLNALIALYQRLDQTIEGISSWKLKIDQIRTPFLVLNALHSQFVNQTSELNLKLFLNSCRVLFQLEKDFNE